jgi:hypothetical protein
MNRISEKTEHFCALTRQKPFPIWKEEGASFDIQNSPKPAIKDGFRAPIWNVN